MTSKRDLLKENMRSSLERGHHRFLSERLGIAHPLTAVQQIRRDNSKVECELRTAKLLTADLAGLAIRRRREVREQTALVRDLEKLNVEKLVDSAVELCESVREVQTALESTVGQFHSGIDEGDVEE